MSNLTVDTKTITVDNKDGEVICEGTLLDLHYAISDMAGNREGKSQAEVYNEVAIMLMEKFRPKRDDNKKYTETITFGTAIKVALGIQSQVNEEKKSTDT